MWRWRERWRRRWLGSADARARIARWPLGREIARGHADRLFALVAGFAATQMLLAALELGVFDALAKGPRPWAGLVDLPPAGSDALRQALVANGLIEAHGATVALTLDGLVVASDPGIAAMIRHDRLLYADLADPVALLRGETGGGRIEALWPYRGNGDPAAYGALMAASLRMVADDLVDLVDWRGFTRVMDVGGGNGAFLRMLRARGFAGELVLADLPQAVAGVDAGDGIAVAGVAPDAPLPPGADAITLVRVLHDQGDDAAAALLARAVAALAPGGRLIVAEPVARGGRDPQTGYFAAYFAAMGSGRLRTRGEIADLLRAAGLRRVRWRTGILTQIAVARA